MVVTDSVRDTVQNRLNQGGDRVTTEGFKTALESRGWSIAQLARRLRESRPRVSAAINHPDAGLYRLQERAARLLGIAYDGPRPTKRKKLTTKQRKEEVQGQDE